jgi:hypothetical protein
MSRRRAGRQWWCRAEQRVLDRDQLEPRPGVRGEAVEQFRHEWGHGGPGDDADPPPVEPRELHDAVATRMRSAVTAPMPFSICGKSP